MLDPGKARSAGLFLLISPAFCTSPEVCSLRWKSTVQIHLGKVFPRVPSVEKGNLIKNSSAKNNNHPVRKTRQIS